MIKKRRGGKEKFYSKRRLKRLGVQVCGKGVLVARSVKVWKGAALFGPCIVTGDSTLCEGCSIHPFSQVKDSFIGRGTAVRASVVEGARVAENCTLGPFCYLRGGADIAKGCRIGDFVEIKSSTLGEGCKAAHHAYIGDAVLGSGVNVGCGTVFANYDGKVKSRSRVGDGCFIGANCNIIAPVSIGRGAYIAAGTTVSRDVKEFALCIGRLHEKSKPRGAEGRYKNG